MVYHRSIVSLSYYKTKSNQFFGSGVLISPNVVLTAAYNIYLRQYQREVDKNTYKVYIGQQGEATTYY